MAAQLPEGLQDIRANARVGRLHAEVQRLAHSSPPIVGRDARIGELKAAVSAIRDYQFGFTSTRWLLSVYKTVLGPIMLGSAGLLILEAVRSEMGFQATAAAIGRVIAYAFLIVAGVAVWDYLKTRRRLRNAEALADSLIGARSETLAKAQ